MPLYILCEMCKRVPVAKSGDKCEDCERKIAQQDAEYKRRLNRLEQKHPNGGKGWRKEMQR